MNGMPNVLFDRDKDTGSEVKFYATNQPKTTTPTTTYNDDVIQERNTYKVYTRFSIYIHDRQEERIRNMGSIEIEYTPLML